MAGASSLLRSAEARRNKVRQQEDAIRSFEYSQSAKTYDDFLEYSKFLEDRLKASSDVSSALSYQKDIVSARKGYISNEIQRQSINIVEGRASSTDKYDAMVNLYYMAADNGDFDLAQSLRLQLDNLSVTIQNEAEAAQRLAGQLADMRDQSVEEGIATIKDYAKSIIDFVGEKGTAGSQEVLDQYGKELGLENGGGDLFGILANLAQSADTMYKTAIESESDPDALRKLQGQYNEFQTGTIFELPSASGSTLKISYQDLIDQADAARTGQQLYVPVQGADGVVYEKNKETGFVWGRDETGNYRIIPIYQSEADYDNTSNIDSDKNGKVDNYDFLLRQAGFDVRKSGNGQLIITPTSDSGDINIPGMTPGQPAVAYIGKDGQLQIKSGDSLYDFNFGNDGVFRGVNKALPSAVTLLNDKFSSDFIRKLDLQRLPPSTIGVIDRDQAGRNITSVGKLSGTVDSLGQVPLTPATVAQPSLNPQPNAKNPQVAAPGSLVQPQMPKAPLQQTVSGTQLVNLPPQPTLSVKEAPAAPKATVTPTVAPKVTVVDKPNTTKLTVR